MGFSRDARKNELCRIGTPLVHANELQHVSVDGQLGFSMQCWRAVSAVAKVTKLNSVRLALQEDTVTNIF
jgi:hypothetical protein